MDNSFTPSNSEHGPVSMIDAGVGGGLDSLGVVYDQDLDLHPVREEDGLFFDQDQVAEPTEAPSHDRRIGEESGADSADEKHVAKNLMRRKEDVLEQMAEKSGVSKRALRAIGRLSAGALTLVGTINVMTDDEANTQESAVVSEYVDSAIRVANANISAFAAQNENIIDVSIKEPIVEEAVTPEALVESIEENLDLKWLPETVAHFEPRMQIAAEKVGLSPGYAAIMPILMTIESGAWPLAESPGVGAQGLGQIMPHMQEALIENFGLDPESDMFNPDDNMEAMALLIGDIAERAERNLPDDATQLDKFRYIAAGYNGGMGMEDEIASGAETLSYSETDLYVKLVTGLYLEADDPNSSTLALWLNDKHGQSLVAAAATWIEQNEPNQ